MSSLVSRFAGALRTALNHAPQLPPKKSSSASTERNSSSLTQMNSEPCCWLTDLSLRLYRCQSDLKWLRYSSAAPKLPPHVLQLFAPLLLLPLPAGAPAPAPVLGEAVAVASLAPPCWSLLPALSAARASRLSSSSSRFAWRSAACCSRLGELGLSWCHGLSDSYGTVTLKFMRIAPIQRLWP